MSKLRQIKDVYKMMILNPSRFKPAPTTSIFQCNGDRYINWGSDRWWAVDNFELSLYFYMPNAVLRQDIFSDYEASNKGHILRHIDGGNIAFLGNIRPASALEPRNLGLQENSYQFRKYGSTVQVLFNGNVVGAQTVAVTPIWGTGISLTLGAILIGSTSLNRMYGYLKDVKFSELDSSGSLVQVLSHLPLTSDYNDISGNGRNGTLVVV